MAADRAAFDRWRLVPRMLRDASVALGARAVCVGRPSALALGPAGRRGVDELLASLIAEFDLTLGLCGYSSVAELDSAVLERS